MPSRLPWVLKSNKYLIQRQIWRVRIGSHTNQRGLSRKHGHRNITTFCVHVGALDLEGTSTQTNQTMVVLEGGHVRRRGMGLPGAITREIEVGTKDTRVSSYRSPSRNRWDLRLRRGGGIGVLGALFTCICLSPPNRAPNRAPKSREWVTQLQRNIYQKNCDVCACR